MYGVSKSLRGEIEIVSIFVNQGANEWNKLHRTMVSNNMRATGKWLQQQAAARAVPLRVHTSTQLTVMDGRDPTRGAGLPTWMDQLLEKAGLGSMERAIADFDRRYNREVVFILHYFLDRRSYALPFLRTALCFRDYTHDRKEVAPVVERIPKMSAALFAHETLHLFGASDKYPDGPWGGIMSNYKHYLPDNHFEQQTLEEIGWA